MQQIVLQAQDGFTQKRFILFSIILCDPDLQPFYLLSVNDKLPIVIQALDPEIVSKPN